jgi:type II secretion system protein J
MRRTIQAGFTLVELLVTLAIMALVMTALLATLQGTVRAHDQSAIDIASVRDGPRILDMIERDLRSIQLYNIREHAVLKGTSERPGGLQGDRIDFLCGNDSSRRVPDSASDGKGPVDVASDLNEVGYRLRSSTLSDDFLELWRREDLFVDEEPFEGGTYEKIHDRVTRFEIVYLDHLGEKSEEKTEWDMSEQKRLPGAIQINLELQASPELVGGFVELADDEQKLYRYTRVIGFPQEMSLAMSVRPYLPTKITGRNDNGGANTPGAGPGGNQGNVLPGGGGVTDGAQGGLGGMPNGGGGKTAIDIINGGGGGGRRQADMHIDLNQPGLDIGPSTDGKLSEQDQKKIEDFLNDYRNRYNGKGGSSGGGTVTIPGSGG